MGDDRFLQVGPAYSEFSFVLRTAASVSPAALFRLEKVDGYVYIWNRAVGGYVNIAGGQLRGHDELSENGVRKGPVRRRKSSARFEFSKQTLAALAAQAHADDPDPVHDPFANGLRPERRDWPDGCPRFFIDVADTTLYWEESNTSNNLSTTAAANNNQVQCPHPRDELPKAWQMVSREVTASGKITCFCGMENSLEKMVWRTAGDSVKEILDCKARGFTFARGAYFDAHFKQRINTDPCIRELVEEMTR